MFLFIDPHGDDVALFAAYQRLQTDEICVALITHQTVPMDEIGEAMRTLDFFWGTKDEKQVREHEFERVYAPAFHPDGHEEHNEAAEFALTFGVPVVPYSTYAPRGIRQGGKEVRYEPWMVARKLRALSCFPSQIEQESTRPWFTSLLDMREWISES